jgi:catechol-2,3-dioxygenase
VPESEPPSGRATERGGPTRIGRIAIPVGDLDRAVRFYEDVLGLRLLFRAPDLLALMSEGRPD